MKWDQLLDRKFLPFVIGGVTVAAVTPVILLWRKRRRKIDVSKYPRDKVTLFQFSRGPWAPSISPFCLKLETYLRMANIPYQNEFGMTRSPQGKLPWMICEGEVVADSQFCIAYLNNLKNLDFNAELDDEERATAWAYQVMMEDHFLWALALWRFSYGLNNPKAKSFIRSALGTFDVILPLIQGQIEAAGRAQGLGRHGARQLEAIGTRDIRALSQFLGDKEFFMGPEPTEVDCSMFGFFGASTLASACFAV